MLPERIFQQWIFLAKTPQEIDGQGGVVARSLSKQHFARAHVRSATEFLHGGRLTGPGASAHCCVQTDHVRLQCRGILAPEAAELSPQRDPPARLERKQ